MDKTESSSPLKPTAQRDLVCLLGLPIDVIDMPSALARVQHAVSSRQRLFLSTPNLNFLVAAQDNFEFRDSVLQSDLSVADGMSIVLLGRLLGCNLPERVTGSDMFEQLARMDNGAPIKVFFFGGQPGAGKMASDHINRTFKGIVCVGYDEAGYGDVASMSSPEIIDRINASGADFVVAALGATKGQAWLMHNRNRLQAPVLSHLGAVINFMAGNVQRSPKWLQKLGLEWVWRIIQEPMLWRRYWHDGLAFVSLLARHGIPNALAERRMKRHPEHSERVVSDTLRDHTRSLTLAGQWKQASGPTLRTVLAKGQYRHLQIDLSQVTWMGVHALGMLTATHGRLQALGGRGVTLLHVSNGLARQIKAAGAGYLIENHRLDLVEVPSRG
jgi:N-acetylglucosaminyldiphosphoundecaprenol N-acetyl-beta-D-mannosaminyltransferase